MLDQLNIALWSKVDVNSLGQEHDRITCSKLSSVEQELQLQEDKTSNNSRVIKRANRIAALEFDYTDKVGFNLDSGLVNLKGGGEEEDVIVIDSDDEGNKKPPAKKYAMPPNITTTIVANPVLPNNVTNNNQVAASSNNVDTNQYYYQIANSQSQYGNNITWGNVGVGRTSTHNNIPADRIPSIKKFACPQCSKMFLTQPGLDYHVKNTHGDGSIISTPQQFSYYLTNNPAVLPNHTNNNKRNYQQMLLHNDAIQSVAILAQQEVS